MGDHLPRFSFGSTPVMAERLAALVVAGRKTATVGSVAGSPEPETRPGMLWIVEAAPGRGVCVVETLEVNQRRFCDIDEVFAAEEGERDLSLSWWRRDHEQYFREEGTFAPDMLLWCERFRLVEVLDEAFAATAPAHVAAEIAGVFDIAANPT